MNKISKRGLTLAVTFFLSLASTDAGEIGVVNFKTCVENSKIGKTQQESFDQLKGQMEKVLGEKETVLNKMSNQFNDAEFLDSLTEEAEKEMKETFRQLTQELSQHQAQYYQMLNQANFQIIQRIQGAIAEAASQVGKKQNLKLLINEESTFYCDDSLDVSKEVVKAMDEIYEQQN